MNVVFRTDASSRIGVGHVMRCLTLAAQLRERGATAIFLCREEPGDLRQLIAHTGFSVVTLTAASDWSADVEATRLAIATSAARPEWLVLDHYGLDHRWEEGVRSSVGSIMVIDDLADREHDCDMLLDQNIENPRHQRYAKLIPAEARLLLGSQYALIRPEFAQLRSISLARRHGQLERLLVTMGGADPANDTAKVLHGLSAEGTSSVPVDVVIGTSNTHKDDIRGICARVPSARLHVQTPRMAELMCSADLAITAGGSTTWERCVLGLPAIVTLQSEDQVAIAEAVASAGGHLLLGWSEDLTPADYTRSLRDLHSDDLARMSQASAELCDGYGAGRVAAELMNWRD